MNLPAPRVRFHQDEIATVERLDLTVSGNAVSIEVLHRPGPKSTIVFLHGFGSTKEDYADAALTSALDGHEIIAYDAPGFGASTAADLSGVTIPFLVETAKAVLAAHDVTCFHLVGHSMGGLTGLLLADELRDRVLTFCNIEGNVAPEDCFLSRQILTHAHDDPEVFLSTFAERVAASGAWSSALYSTSVGTKVRAAVVRSVFESMVELSDSGTLLPLFTNLSFPRQFMYGDANQGLSYLQALGSHGIELAEIEQCGHFPMYSNAPAMWAAITRLQSRTGHINRSR